MVLVATGCYPGSVESVRAAVTISVIAASGADDLGVFLRSLPSPDVRNLSSPKKTSAQKESSDRFSPSGVLFPYCPPIHLPSGVMSNSAPRSALLSPPTQT